MYYFWWDLRDRQFNAKPILTNCILLLELVTSLENYFPFKFSVKHFNFYKNKIQHDRIPLFVLRLYIVNWEPSDGLVSPNAAAEKELMTAKLRPRSNPSSATKKLNLSKSLELSMLQVFYL